MVKKTYINIEGKSYVSELQNTPVQSRNGFDIGRLFTISDKRGEIIGCLSVFLSIITHTVWKTQEKITPEIEEKLYLRILPHVPFAASITDFSLNYPKSVQLFITPSNSGYDKEKKIQDVRSYESPEELVNALVFNGEIDEDKVQKDILTYLYEEHMEDHTEYTNTGELAKALFINEKIVLRCLKYLDDDGYVEEKSILDTAGFAFSKITTVGVRYVRNNFQQIHSGTGVIVMGDYVGNDKITTNINGDRNQNIVKSSVSNSFNITEVYKKADNLIEKIKQEYTDIDKNVLIGQIEEIKTLAAEKKNFSRIREMLGGIMTRTAEVATIAVACLDLYKFFAVVK